MKNQELFNKTVAILVKAYFDNTLQHGNACGCAVGNLIADARGFTIRNPGTKSAFWDDNKGHSIHYPLWNSLVHNTGSFYRGYDTYPYEKSFRQLAIQDLRSTGYSEHETFKIELAFENKRTGDRGRDIYNGLMRVIDYLMTIHEASIEEATEAKGLFVTA